MSDRRGTLVAGALAAGLACLAGAAPLEAQSASEWRARLDGAVEASVRADSEYVRTARAALAPRTALIIAGERRVSFSPEELSSVDSARVAEGLANGRARLVEKFGAAAGQLLDSATWTARGSQRMLGFPGMVAISTADFSRGLSVRMARPVDPRLVEGLVLHAAGDGLSRIAPALRPLSGGAVALDDDPEQYAFAGREMALSWAASGRRCMAGAVAACRAVLTMAPPGERLALYFEPADWRAVVTSGESPLTADSVFFADRRRCLADAPDAAGEAACARIVDRVKVVDPFSKSLRATIVMHAFSVGAHDALGRLASTEETEPMGILAAVAGMEEDALIASWQQRIAAAVADERESTFPLALSILGWGALAVVGVARRKP